MKTVAQRIKDAINRKGFITVKECAQALGLPYELLRKVVGEDHIPKDEQLLVYARKLGIDPKELLFTAYHQKAPSEFKEYFEKKVVREAPVAYNKIPLLDLVQAGGYTSGTDQYPYKGVATDYVETDLQGRHLFAVRVSGDSMEPLFHEGEVLIVDPEIQPQSGDYAIVKAEREEGAGFRQMKKFRGVWLLHPLNPRYEDQEMSKEMRVIGKVVRKQMDF
jgi:phage repressor protein C with HTH and peptisase S24 domain